MKSKKIISCLMALSIVGTSSLMFGGTANAASLNSTNNNSTIKMNFNFRYDAMIDGDINSKGDVFWTRTSGARSNEIEVRKVSGERVVAFGGGPDYLSLNLKRYVKDVGNYVVDIRAIDQESHIMAYDKFYFYYDGKIFNSLKPHSNY